MSKFFTKEEAARFEQAGDEPPIPADGYLLRILSVEPSRRDPDTKVFTFEVASGEYAGRILRAWKGTGPKQMWALKKLIGEIVVDPAELELADLEGHVFAGEVTVEERKDGEGTVNRVERLTPCEFVPELEPEPLVKEDDDLPF